MPTQPLGWFKKPISKFEDMKGLKFRTVGISIDMFTAMGASVNALPGGEIIPAMDRGLLDAAEFNNASSDRQLGFPDVSKVCMLQSYHQNAEQFEILFNRTCPPLDDWLSVEGQTIRMGHQGPGFAFDNESPSHLALIQGVDIRVALVTNDEYLQFMRDGGYQRHSLWHAEGWDWVQTLKFRAPMYWQPDPNQPDGWGHYTLQGVMPLTSQAPVTHVSYYEAHAFCDWAGWRLPTEFEWEAAASRFDWGRRWEWTRSAYQPYPGFARSEGAVGEYNGKFMVNQQVLRGASWATSPGHARLTYRNFFHAPLRWQFTGIRPVRSRESA